MKQLQKLVKVRYVEDITDAERVGKSNLWRSSLICDVVMMIVLWAFSEDL